VEGKERVVESDFQKGVQAHAFTDPPKEFIGKLEDVIAMPLADRRERAIFIATMNAVLKHCKIIETTLHRKDEAPEACAVEIASHIRNTLGSKKVGLIGLNTLYPGGAEQDLRCRKCAYDGPQPEKYRVCKYSVTVWDDNTMTEKLVQESDIVLMTGTILVNGSFDKIWSAVREYEDYLV